MEYDLQMIVMEDNLLPENKIPSIFKKFLGLGINKSRLFCSSVIY